MPLALALQSFEKAGVAAGRSISRCGLFPLDQLSWEMVRLADVLGRPSKDRTFEVVAGCRK